MSTKRGWFVFLVASMVLGLSLLAGLSQAQRPEAQDGRAPLAALGTTITYQGHLLDNGQPANGLYDFGFTLFDAAVDGNIVGNLIVYDDLAVSGGLFTAALDFGSGAFDGEARWLEVEVRPGAGLGAYALLRPRQALTPAPYALALPGLRTEEKTMSPNVIGGHVLNKVADGVVGATIGGGGSGQEACGTGGLEPCTNSVADDYGTVSGGSSNQAGNGIGSAVDAMMATVGGGSGNTASGQVSTVGGGAGNIASGPLATIAGGEDNVASSINTAVGGGVHNRASGDYATIPGGSEAIASHYGEMAYASGAFGGWTGGDAQASLYVLRNTTTNATETELFLDGVSERLTLAAGRALSFDILVVGTSDAGQTAGYRIWGVIENVGGTTTMVGASGLVFGEDDGAWGAIGAADDSNNALVVRVTGNSGDTVRWVAVVHTAEAAWQGAQ